MFVCVNSHYSKESMLPYGGNLWFFQPNNWYNGIPSLKYLSTLGCKDIRIRTLELAVKTQFIWTNLPQIFARFSPDFFPSANICKYLQEICIFKK